MQPEIKFTVSEFTEVLNQSMEYAYTGVTVVGEVAEYKVNQGKWVFFNLKDENSVISCFIPIFNLRIPLEDGMKVQVKGTPKLTKWGKFSFTVMSILPVGEGSIKKSFELLKAKLEKEGLFDPKKKRPLPENLTEIGVISSPDAAGYADFVKILGERWGGLHITLARTQVQGLVAADQIIKALNYFNEHGGVQIIAIIRGGGSKDDLAVFNDEKLVRAISASKIPVITGIGHEIDTSLADLAADLVGSTPSNVAQLLTSDKNSIISSNRSALRSVSSLVSSKIDQKIADFREKLSQASRETVVKITTYEENIKSKKLLLETLNPENVLKQGYSIISGEISPGNVVKITTFDKIIETEVKNVRKRDN